MKNFLWIDNELRNNITNLDKLQDFDKTELNILYKWGVFVIQPNYKADKYMLHITKLIEEYIDGCKQLFPETIKFDYIRHLFVIPRYKQKGVMIEEYNKFKRNRSWYPFQMYMYWQPENCGNILCNDNKFLSIIYEQNGEEFYERYKYIDASDATKENIYEFIHKSKRLIMAVDCENSSPYKLYAVLKNLNAEDLALIDKIILYDDYHTTLAWDYIEKLVQIPVEHIEGPRVTDAKSLVDIRMAVGVSVVYYRDNIDSFILCSSDSDFWRLISSIPDARFLVIYENAKCGQAIKEALTTRNIFHCSLDDFYTANAGELEQVVLKKILMQHLSNIIGENAWELTKQIYADAFIEVTEKDIERFYEKYIKRLRLKIDKEGIFYIALDE